MVVHQTVSIHLSYKRQIHVNLGGTGSNLNYMCLVVFSRFSAKYFDTQVPISSTYETRKNQINGKPSHDVIICVLLSVKNQKLGIRQFS